VSADFIERATDWQRPPDGMQPHDWPLWFRFRDAHAADYLAFAFNVRLPTLTPPFVPNDPTAAAFVDALAKRVDVVAIRGDGAVDLIEVARRPTPGSLGQLLLYRWLWLRHQPRAVAALVLLGLDIDADLRAFAESLGVRVVLV